MANRLNGKMDNKKLKILIISFVVVIIFAIIITGKKPNDENYENMTEEEIAEAQEDEFDTERLEELEERDRMEYYFGKFLSYIEDEQYEKAYDMLYSEFKKNYFPTLEEFTEYAEKTFSDMSSIRHENIERNGDVYVLWIYVSDALNGKPGEETEMNFVIRENDYNDVEVSFSVK